jgi:hypothetical protein
MSLFAAPHWEIQQGLPNEIRIPFHRGAARLYEVKVISAGLRRNLNEKGIQRGSKY